MPTSATTPTPFRALGVDASLSAFGVATLTDGVASVRTIKTDGHNDDPLEVRRARLRRIADEIIAEGLAADVVVIEQPAYAQSVGKTHDRSGLWWLIVDELLPRVPHLIEVSPQTVKKYATGKGNAGKAAVIVQVTKRYPGVEVADDNQADALVLAAIGARLAGRAIEASLPAANLDALAKVRWPK